jgi:hypothetical protein
MGELLADGAERLPIREGLKAVDVADDGPAPGKMRHSWTLSERAADYAFFNHGCLLELGRFGDQDPLQAVYDRVAAASGESSEMFFEYEYPSRFPLVHVDKCCFESLPLRHFWPWVILGVRKEYWPEVFNHLRAVAPYQSPRPSEPEGFFGRSNFSRITMPDPTGGPARIAVWYFGIDSTEGCYYYEETMTGPRLSWSLPARDLMDLADAVLCRESHTPFRATEPTRLDVDADRPPVFPAGL